MVKNHDTLFRYTSYIYIYIYREREREREAYILRSSDTLRTVLVYDVTWSSPRAWCGACTYKEEHVYTCTTNIFQTQQNTQLLYTSVYTYEWIPTLYSALFMRNTLNNACNVAGKSTIVADGDLLPEVWSSIHACVTYYPQPSSLESIHS